MKAIVRWIKDGNTSVRVSSEWRQQSRLRFYTLMATDKESVFSLSVFRAGGVCYAICRPNQLLKSLKTSNRCRTGKYAFLEDGVYAPIAVNHLSDAEVDADGHE